ncbi:TatD family hydrolase [Pleurocapsales cyanobacterium LEGE 10410]|nr:TatD family hydrolase [Pleurocapsales cyanobacterium LEGE 10410]
MIDMHCHLDLYPNFQQVIKRCEKQKIYVLSVTTTPKAWHGTKAISKNCERIKTSLGLHPQLAHERHKEIYLFDDFISDAKYVGEIGLDGSKEYKQHQKIQAGIFKHILNTTQKAGGRIMSIHSRAATDSVLDCLDQYKDAGIPILHWFTGTQSQLRTAIGIGCWFSIGPAMLATKKGKLIAQNIPKERILTETDGPFATLNKKKLMPWDISKAISQLSNLWQISTEETELILFSNFKSILRDS